MGPVEIIRELTAAQAVGDRLKVLDALARLRGWLGIWPPTDAMLAADCKGLLAEDGAAAVWLDMPSDPHDARMGRAFALVLDREGRGHVVEVLVVLAAGSGDVWTPQPMGPEVQASAQLAIAAALGGAVVHSSVRWQVRAACDHLLLLRGRSLGLALAVAVRAALLQREAPSDWAFTGGVDLDGGITQVSGLPAKLRAARAAGLGHVALPMANRPGLRPPAGLALRTAPTIETIFGEIGLSPPRPGAGRRLLAHAARRWMAVAAIALALLLGASTRPAREASQVLRQAASGATAGVTVIGAALRRVSHNRWDRLSAR